MILNQKHVYVFIMDLPLTNPYSLLRFFTGFVNAALIAWKLIVPKAITMAVKPAARKIHQPTLTLYAKSCSHLLILHHAIGTAITAAIITSFKKSFDNMPTILLTE